MKRDDYHELEMDEMRESEHYWTVNDLEERIDRLRAALADILARTQSWCEANLESEGANTTPIREMGEIASAALAATDEANDSSVATSEGEARS